MDQLQEKVNKLEALRQRGTPGEQAAAEAALKRLKDKYGIEPDDDGEEKQDYEVTGLTPQQKQMLHFLVHKEGGTPFTWRHRRNYKTKLMFSCSEDQHGKIMDQFNRHKPELEKYLDAMTIGYCRDNNLALIEKTTVKQEMSDIEIIIARMDFETNKEERVEIEETKQIGG